MVVGQTTDSTTHNTPLGYNHHHQQQQQQQFLLFSMKTSSSPQSYPQISCVSNTLRTGDADLRIYFTIVQDG
jgi:hypothetical protein